MTVSLTGWGLPVLLSVLAAVTLVPLVLGLPRRKGAREASLRAAQLSPTAPVIPDLPPLPSAERDQTFTVTGAVTGFSAGGWCAAYIGMKNPAQFGAAQVFGSCFKPLFAKGHNPLTAEQLASPDDDLAAMAGAVKTPIAIWTQTARGDSLSYPSTSAFFKAVQAPTSATEMSTEGGGHAYYLWRPHVQESLAWLGRTLPGFAPGR